MTGDCGIFKFIQHSVDGKYLMHFRRETSVFKYFRHSVYLKLLELIASIQFYKMFLTACSDLARFNFVSYTQTWCCEL